MFAAFVCVVPVVAVLQDIQDRGPHNMGSLVIVFGLDHFFLILWQAIWDSL